MIAIQRVGGHTRAVVLTCLLAASCGTEVTGREDALANANVTLEHSAVVSLGSCSATIVAHGVALSAAHCRTDGGRAPLYMHRPDGTIQKLADVSHWVNHPDRTYIDHDVALLFFDPEASRQAGVLPIEIDWNALRRNENLELVGHGGLHESLPLDYQKRQGVARVVRVENKTAWLERGELVGVGACSGDSGGPALRVANEPMLVGIMTHAGEPCGIETRVQRLDVNREWIARTVRDERPTTHSVFAGTVEGQLGGIDSEGLVSGWLCDPDVKRAPLLALYYDGRWHVEERTVFMAMPISARCANGAYFFDHQLTAPERLCDEPVIAAGWNVSGTPGANFRLLNGSGARLECESERQHEPTGTIISLTHEGRVTTVHGWADDADRNAGVWLRFWSADPGVPSIISQPPRLVDFLGHMQTDESGFFEASLLTPRWPLQICVFAVNQGVGGSDQLLGCDAVYSAPSSTPLPLHGG